MTNAPITLSAKLSNMGNVHENATIVIKATDFFTGNVIVEGNTEEEYYSEIVLSETTRLVVRDINEGLSLLGIVRVAQTINYNGQTSAEARNVIICPVWFFASGDCDSRRDCCNSGSYREETSEEEAVRGID